MTCCGYLRIWQLVNYIPRIRRIGGCYGFTSKMMWFFRHFLIFISYHIFLLNQVEGAIAIPPSNSVPLPLFCPSVYPSVCPSIGLLTTFSGFCTFADKSLGRNGVELEMQMFPDDLPLANIDADGYCCHFFCFFFHFFSKVRVGAKEGGSHYWEMAVAITCGYGGYLLPLLAAHSSLYFVFYNKWWCKNKNNGTYQ